MPRKLKGAMKMNFKIEANYINITNYPSIEEHFQEMAKEGWMIKRIIMGSLFIYEKIEPSDLEFSITPYEVETAFTRKSKEELEEFQTVSKSVGWNYVLKTFNLHIYCKEADQPAIDLQTDEEEKFKTLEFIGKKQLKSLYILTPIFLFFSWSILGGLFAGTGLLKRGSVQIISPVIPFGILLSIKNIFHMRKFLKENRENIKLGRDIEFSSSKFILERITLSLFLFLLIPLALHYLYNIFVLRNKIMVIIAIPIIIGAIGGLLYRRFVKPSRRSLGYKKFGFVLMLASVSIVSLLVSQFSGLDVTKTARIYLEADKEDLRILSFNDFHSEEEFGDLIKEASPLVPKAYTYISHGSGKERIETEYSKGINRSIAERLVKKHKREGRENVLPSYHQELEYSFEKDEYVSQLELIGLSKEEFIELKDKPDGEEKVEELVKNKAVFKANEELWNSDEAYFLNYRKTKIVIRQGEEVFYLKGKDFSDPEIVEITKTILEL